MTIANPRRMLRSLTLALSPVLAILTIAATVASAADPVQVTLRLGTGDDIATVKTATPQVAIDVTGITQDPDAKPDLQCWVDSDAPVTCSNPWTMGPLTNGIHTAYIKMQVVVGKPPISITQDVVASTTFRVAVPEGIPAIVLGLKVPKSARASKSMKLNVSCPEDCTLTPTLRIGGKKVKGLRSIKLKPGTSTVKFKLPAKVVRQVKSARKRNSSVKVTLGLNLKTKHDTVKNSIRNMK
jgi:hypothetical protein